MSKRLLPLLFAVVMLFALCACQDTAETKPDFPQTVTDEWISPIEGIPAIRFDGTWKNIGDDDGEGYKALAFYKNQDPESAYVAVGIYSWE